MSHNKSLDDQKFDTRLVNWNLKRGVISESDFNRHLESLPDSSENAQKIEIDDGSEDSLN